MLLEDILQFIEQEHGLQAQDNYFKDQERAVVATFEAQVKEQYPNKEKEAQFELTIIKCTKMLKLLQDQAYQNSLSTYLSYHLPKYKEIIQIVLMLLGKPKNQINLPRSNTLNHRLCIQKAYIQKMMEGLEEYELRRQSSEAVGNEYKINKLLERRTNQIIQCKRLTGKPQADTIHGFMLYQPRLSKSAGLESSAVMPKSRLMKPKLKPKMIETLKQQSTKKKWLKTFRQQRQS